MDFFKWIPLNGYGCFFNVAACCFALDRCHILHEVLVSVARSVASQGRPGVAGRDFLMWLHVSHIYIIYIYEIQWLMWLHHIRPSHIKEAATLKKEPHSFKLILLNLHNGNRFYYLNLNVELGSFYRY